MTFEKERVEHLNDVVINSIRELRRLKQAYPNLRCDFYKDPGSILNAYREGDIDFQTAVEELEKWKSHEDRSSSHTPLRSHELVLSLFPGVDFLGRAFEANGFCVVRGPDTLWDQKIENFVSPPSGHFDGIIGGPPCQNYSDANRHRNEAEGDRLVMEFLRIVDGSRPNWFLMENVRNVPDVCLDGYRVQRIPITDCECGGSQKRLRHIQFGSLSNEVIRPP